ncbi:MAG: hypothetical protein ACTSRE_10380 [Promethearchaeota archaeon]
MAVINLVYAIWQTVVFIIAIIITANAGIQYKKKKTTVAKHLYIAFIIFTLAALFQCSPTVVKYIQSDIVAFDYMTNINWIDTYIITVWDGYQLAYYFLALGVYFLYLFSMDLIFEEGTKKAARIVPAFFIPVFVVYGMFLKPWVQSLIPGDGELESILTGIDVWIGLYIIILMIPLIVDSARVIRTLESGDSMKVRFAFLIVFATSLIIMIICFVVESFVGTTPNAFSFVAWLFAVSALVFSYMGLYRKR